MNQKKKGKGRRKIPAVQRHVSRGCGTLYLPPGYVLGERADLYSDGNGRLAIEYNPEGKFKMIATSRGSSIKMMTIPKAYATRFPLKTTDVTVYWENNMLILNTLQFPEPEDENP
jgi:hypothetical protein